MDIWVSRFFKFYVAYMCTFVRVYTWEFSHNMFQLFIKILYTTPKFSDKTVFTILWIHWKGLLLHGVSCGRGMIAVIWRLNRLQAAGARMAGWVTAQFRVIWSLDWELSRDFWLLQVAGWAASEQGSKSIPQERKLPGQLKARLGMTRVTYSMFYCSTYRHRPIRQSKETHIQVGPVFGDWPRCVYHFYLLFFETSFCFFG